MSSVSYPSSNNNNGCELLGVDGDPSTMTTPVIGLVDGVRTWIEAPSGGGSLDFQKVIDSYTPLVTRNGVDFIAVDFMGRIVIDTLNGVTIDDLDPSSLDDFGPGDANNWDAASLTSTHAELDINSRKVILWPLSGDINVELYVRTNDLGFYNLSSRTDSTVLTGLGSVPWKFYSNAKLLPINNFKYVFEDGVSATSSADKRSGFINGVLNHMWVKGELEYDGGGSTTRINILPNLYQDSISVSGPVPSWYSLASS